MNSRKIIPKTIYLDMDGVLADFNLAARILINASEVDEQAAFQQGSWKPEQWNKIKENPRFYLTLPKTNFADELVSIARTFRDKLDWDLKILTAIPRNNDMHWAFYDKILWQQQYYPDIPVMFGPYSKDKHQHCKPGDILIDDRQDNCNQWTRAFGTAIKIDQNPFPSLLYLKNILENLINEKTIL